MESDRGRFPIYLMLTEREGQVSGLALTGMDAKPAAIDRAELRGGELSFEVCDYGNRLLQFRLRLTDGVLGGEATAENEIFRVAVVPAGGGGGGDRMPLGPGSGRGVGSNLPAGVHRVGGSVSAPAVIARVEPEYTEEARAAQYQGTVLLYVEITPEGRATNVRVQRPLGLGLNEKAVEAVSGWRFRPGHKDGKPVTVAVTIEVNFRM